MSVDPATAALVLSIASTGASVVGQMQTAKQQEAANEAQEKAAMRSYIDNIEASNRQTIQEAEAATDKSNKVALEGRKAKATAITAAGEAGVSGLSVDSLLRDLSGQTLENVNSIESNYLRRREGIEVDRINMRNRTISEISAIQRPMTPDLIGAGLSIGSEFVNYRTDRTNPNKTTWK